MYMPRYRQSTHTCTSQSNSAYNEVHIFTSVHTKLAAPEAFTDLKSLLCMIG